MEKSIHLFIYKRVRAVYTVMELEQACTNLWDTIYVPCVNVNIRMYNFDDVQCTVIPSVAYGFVTGMNLQLC